jgi:hypothetical protein
VLVVYDDASARRREEVPVEVVRPAIYMYPHAELEGSDGEGRHSRLSVISLCSMRCLVAVIGLVLAMVAMM